LPGFLPLSPCWTFIFHDHSFRQRHSIREDDVTL
jgi:hypothetical protein